MALCPECLVLMDRITIKVHDLRVATDHMAMVAGVGQRAAFRASRDKVQKIRAEHQILAANLTRHRAESHYQAASS